MICNTLGELGHPKKLEDYTWAEISDIAKSGIASKIFKVGDTKSFLLNGTILGKEFNQTIDAFIIGFDHNASIEGTNRIHFQVGKIDGTFVVLTNKYFENDGKFVMYEKDISNGSWENCYMRNIILGNSDSVEAAPEGSFLSLLPSDLKSVIVPVHKITDKSVESSMLEYKLTTFATDDYLFLLSEHEIYGFDLALEVPSQYSQKQYEYYGRTRYYRQGNNPSLVAVDSTDMETPVYWWLRNQYAKFFSCVHPSGYDGNYNGVSSFGISFCFTVGGA